MQYHRLGSHMPFYCTAPSEYHHSCSGGGRTTFSLLLGLSCCSRARRRRSHFRYFSPVQPARSARPGQPRRGATTRAAGGRSDGFLTALVNQPTMLLTDVRPVGPSVRPSVLVQLSSKIFSPRLNSHSPPTPTRTSSVGGEG